MGPVCRTHFRKDTNCLKKEIGFSNIGDLKKIWNRAKTLFLVRIQYSPPPILKGILGTVWTFAGANEEQGHKTLP